MSVFLLRGDVGHATFPRNPEQVHQPAGTLTEWRFEGKIRKGARGNLVADKDSVVAEEEETSAFDDNDESLFDEFEDEPEPAVEVPEPPCKVT